jgi:2-iminobutanoate/2-iminopropanoate deaminase
MSELGGRSRGDVSLSRHFSNQDVRLSMKGKRVKEIIRVEPLASLLENYKAPTSTVVKHGDTLYVTGAPPYDKNGEIIKGPGTIKQQTEAVLEQMKSCLEGAGSSMENVLKANIYCTSVDMFPEVNEVYRRYFPKDYPARIFINVPAWNGGFDIEIDCIAAA